MGGTKLVTMGENTNSDILGGEGGVEEVNPVL